jgi:hypothetical protein
MAGRGITHPPLLRHRSIGLGLARPPLQSRLAQLEDSLLPIPAWYRCPPRGSALDSRSRDGPFKRGPVGEHPAARSPPPTRMPAAAARAAAALSPLAGSSRRGGDAGGPPQLAACRGGVDILQGAPVNAPASGGLNRRKPLRGRQLQTKSRYGRRCDNSQARVVIQTV